MQLAKHEVEASYYAVLYQTVINSFPVSLQGLTYD